MAPPDILGQVPYFRLLSPHERAALARRGRERVFSADGGRDASIFTEGKPCDGLWVVLEGRVKVFRLSARGRAQVLHTEGPGTTLGEVPLFDRGGYVASASAVGRARLLWLPRAEVEALCRRRPEVALAIIATMARRVRAFAALAGDLAFREVHERLALFLLEETRRLGQPTPRGLEVILPGTRDDVAAHIGTVRELVSRSLARMQREGLLALRGRRVVLLDVGRLAALAGREGG